MLRLCSRSNTNTYTLLANPELATLLAYRRLAYAVKLRGLIGRSLRRGDCLRNECIRAKLQSTNAGPDGVIRKHRRPLQLVRHVRIRLRQVRDYHVRRDLCDAGNMHLGADHEIMLAGEVIEIDVGCICDHPQVDLTICRVIGAERAKQLVGHIGTIRAGDKRANLNRPRRAPKRRQGYAQFNTGSNGRGRYRFQGAGGIIGEASHPSHACTSIDSVGIAIVDGGLNIEWVVATRVEQHDAVHSVIIAHKAAVGGNTTAVGSAGPQLCIVCIERISLAAVYTDPVIGRETRVEGKTGAYKGVGIRSPGIEEVRIRSHVIEDVVTDSGHLAVCERVQASGTSHKEKTEAVIIALQIPR